jgi:branched-chain amino acid transport system ATP-binding protein
MTAPTLTRRPGRSPTRERPQPGGARGAVGVTVDFSGLTALDDVTFSVSAGEIVGLIGPNGAGKTTLLNVLTGFQEPTRGRVLLDEENDITKWSAHRVARSGVARTFQGVRPFGALTVRENVEVGALGAGARRREARGRAEELLGEYGLGDLADLPASALPAGLQRRLGIARALASRPRVLLLDEPAAGLNEVEGDELVGLVSDVRARVGCAIVVVEHAMRVIMQLCERLHVLDGGSTLATGTPAEIRANQAVREAYLGAGVGDA